MARRDEIVDYAEILLECSSYSDYGPNGLQVVGTDHVTRIVSAVSCTHNVFERAAAAGAQMVLVHHGLFWPDTPQTIDRLMRARLKVLFDYDINLVAFHLPLDGHSEFGNNALIASHLALDPTGIPFAIHGNRSLGVLGRYAIPVSYEEFTIRVANVMQRRPLVLGAPPQEIRTVAICSGGAARDLPEAVELGADAFITGEPTEPTHAIAAEAGIAFYAAGHYATEVFGVQTLGAHIADRFGVEHTFLSVENPV